LLNLESLRADRGLIAQIDWDITPRQAFETYQLKAPGNQAGRGLSPVVYFYVSAWAGETPSLVLVRRGLKHSEELAAIAAPPDMLARAVEASRGAMVPKGQAELTDELSRWLKEKLDA